ncbi:hypothetical protein ACFQ3S_02355 [Mucilaginibacter terrae]|uniref:hypothetical protein n=1 Tax=Mucilaginibacter terrae TaxID=1955052 RepID=UPI00362D26D0
MKKLNFFFTLLLFTGSVQAQTTWTNKSRLLPDKLRLLPVGILMSHDPNPCYPVKTGDTFYWIHNTKATAVYRELSVVECGSFIWYDDSGWHDNMHYSPVDFAKAFNCPGAILKKGRTFTYQKNTRYGKQAYGGDALWYIIAKDKAGKLYKGIALIETESTISTSK